MWAFQCLCSEVTDVYTEVIPLLLAFRRPELVKAVMELDEFFSQELLVYPRNVHHGIERMRRKGVHSWQHKQQIQ